MDKSTCGAFHDNPVCGSEVLRVVFDVLEQRQGLSVEQQQELGQVGAPQGQAGFQHEHLGTTTGCQLALQRGDNGGSSGVLTLSNTLQLSCD